MTCSHSIPIFSSRASWENKWQVWLYLENHDTAGSWSEWYCSDADPHQPLISPLSADLRGLAPIYIQAGEAEILYDMIQAFADKAQE
jgi:acetyl esterase/lipase